jgi:DNA-binding NarL/FixJ family response regulator
MMRMLIVDEQPLFREALAMHLEAMYPGVAVFEADNVAEALGMLDMYVHFDLIVLDIPVSKTEGVAWLHALREVSPDSKFVVMSCWDDTARAKALIGQGANGYIAKSAGAGEVRNAMHLILAGEIYISPSLLRGETTATVCNTVVTTPAMGVHFSLTPRQTEILHLMTQGLPNKSIANRLNCSGGTVKLHVSAILRALQVHNRTEAVRLVARMGEI